MALLLLAAMFGVWFGRFAWLRITLEPTPRPHHYEALILALDPAPDDPAIAEQAMDLLSFPPWVWDEAPTDFFSGVDVSTRPAVAAIVPNRHLDITTVLQGPWDANRPDMAAATAIFSWDEFEKARRTMGELAMTGWRERLDLSTGLLPSIGAYRTWSRWLVAHSRWVRETRGDPAIAVEDWLIALRLARQLHRLQLLLPQMVASGMERDVASEMRLAVIEGIGEVDTAALFRDVDAILAPLEPPSQVLEGERLWLHHCLESAFVREGGDWLAVGTAAESAYWGVGSPPTDSQVCRLWNLTSPLFHNLATARANVDAYIASLNVCTDIAICQQTVRLDSGKVLPPPGALDGFIRLASGYGCPLVDYNISALKFAYMVRCELDAAVTMLALEEYCRDAGCYPESLDQLVPHDMHRLPVDYGDRQTLRYLLDGHRCILYSVGLNGVDDGGVDTGRRPEDFDDNENLDILFSGPRREGLTE
ncbi:MAG: hypothetical protein GXY55_07115 [Phycisphaerae bacterium]|nr:hypothetical protein [Phycisphaerae bacterium]